MNMMELTTENFDQVVSAKELLFIDFWATWCGPCKSFAKVIEKVAEDYPDVTFASINIEEQKELAEDFQIMSVPAVMILRNQVIIFAETGTMSDNALRDLLDKAKSIESETLEKEKER